MRKNSQRWKTRKQRIYNEGYYTHERLKERYRLQKLQGKVQSGGYNAERQRSYRSTPQGKLLRRLSYHRRKAKIAGNGFKPYSKVDVDKRFSLFGNCCAYCGTFEQLTLDHVVCIDQGGEDSIENIVPACSRCNCSKSVMF